MPRPNGDSSDKAGRVEVELFKPVKRLFVTLFGVFKSAKNDFLLIRELLGLEMSSRMRLGIGLGLSTVRLPELRSKTLSDRSRALEKGWLGLG